MSVSKVTAIVALSLTMTLGGAFVCVQAAGANKDSLRRSISANEALIVRFEKQAQQEADPKKLADLHIKIERLQADNEALRNELFDIPVTDKKVPLAPVKRDPEALPAASAKIKTFEELTGSDWSKMSLKEREIFVFTGIGGLERQGVFITRPPRDYIEALDKILSAEPVLGKEFLDDLFVFCVYDGEPQTRPAIDRIREQAMKEVPHGTAL